MKVILIQYNCDSFVGKKYNVYRMHANMHSSMHLSCAWSKKLQAQHTWPEAEICILNGDIKIF